MNTPPREPTVPMARAGATAPLVDRGRALEALTLGWNAIEAIVAIASGIAAGSVALVGFGIDSVIESLSGGVLLWRLQGTTGNAREETARLARPRLLVMDEPSMGLSPRYVDTTFEIIQELNRQGIGILLVEQNANMALNAADYGYVLENGRIVMEDTCERLREKEDIKEFYLGIKESGVRGTRRWRKKKTWR